MLLRYCAASSPWRLPRRDRMEAAITAPRGGLISRVAIAPVQQVEGGDLLAAVTVAEETGPE